MGGYATKYRDSSWQVLVSDQWIRVDSESDAYAMSASLELLHRVADGDLVGEEVAQKLESVAALFTKYGCDAEAAFIIEHVKFARDQPSKKLS
jgi:hypothetical protein